MWARFTDDGIPAWFGPVPIPGAESVAGVDEETLLTCRRVKGEWVAREPVVPVPPSPEEIEAARLAGLAETKAQALARVTATVQALRLRLVTPLPGQDAIYLQKQMEAARYLAGPEPATLDGFPFLAAEVGITAPTARDLAQVWLNMAHMFALVGAATEGARKAAEAGIAAAEDAAAVQEAEARFAAALGALG